MGQLFISNKSVSNIPGYFEKENMPSIFDPNDRLWEADKCVVESLRSKQTHPVCGLRVLIFKWYEILIFFNGGGICVHNMLLLDVTCRFVYFVI